MRIPRIRCNRDVTTASVGPGVSAAAGDGEQLFRESSNDPHPPLISSQTWTLGCGNLDIGAFGAQGAVLNFSPTSK